MITNEKSTPEERALARIFSHKNLVTGIAAIKEKFQLDDSNDIWKRMIFEVGKKKKMKLKKAGKWVEPAGRDRKPVQKMNNKPQIEREEWLKNNTETTEIDEEVKKCNKKKTEKVEGKNLKRKAPVKVEESSESSEDETNSDTEKLSNESKESDESEEEEEEEEIVKKPVNKKIKKEEIEIKEEIPVQTVDSFFITESGSNYMSSVVLDQNQNDEDINTDLPFHKKVIKKNIVHTPGINRRQRRQGITVPTFVPQPIETPKKKLNEDVHPSWLAKQKQRSIQEFQGKKITFDDSGNNSKKFVTAKISVPEPVPDKTLHPSWAAKLKQKPIMTEFKGSKIVFDD